jgi:serine/threonine protein phosphatase PrpC
MAEIVNSTPDPQAVCSQLIALANERGGPDNSSVIVIKAEAE